MGGTMKKSVVISVIGSQLSDEAGVELMEMMTEGTLTREGDEYCLTYQETETTGLEGTTTTIKVTNQEVSLIRFGSVNSQFVFSKGKKHLSYYETSYGSFMIGITTNSSKVELGDDGGFIDIGYGMEINHGEVTYNQIQVVVREPGKGGG